MKNEISLDWNMATNGTMNVTSEESGKIILPLVLQYLTPAVRYNWFIFLIFVNYLSLVNNK